MQRAATRLATLLGDLEHFGVKLGLERIEKILSALGSPQDDLPAVLVAGTNGKGSTAATLAAIVTAAGYRSGLYTSPHLEAVEERIRVDGAAVPTDVLVELVEEVMASARRIDVDQPTYFEVLTATALCHFRRAEIDLAILEVGMGGRLDATNVCCPVLSIITSIGLDHESHLGGDTASIAREKGGILRPGRPALVAIRDRRAFEALERLAGEMGAELEAVEAEGLVRAREPRPRLGQLLEIETAQGRYRIESRLEGRHQVDNLLLAVLAAERLGRLGFDRIDRSTVERGVAAARWPGRLEWVTLPAEPHGGGELLLDAAHNASGWEALGRYLDEVDRPFDLLFGVLRDKRRSAAMLSLAGRAGRLIVATPPSKRALPAAELAGWLERPAESVPEPASALEAILEPARAAGRLVVVCGSIYLVGAVREALRRRWGVPAESTELFAADPGDAR